MLPTTINQVLASLDNIIQDAIKAKNPTGYFAALYRTVTAEVQKGIHAGEFQDGARMEKLDVIFANRYLVAHDAYFSGQACSQAWKIAFDETRNNQLLVLHHLFLGMTAHILLDLGIAAAEVCPGEQIHNLSDDFKKINEVLGSMVNGVEEKLTEISPPFFLIDFLGGKSDERLAGFCMRIAREGAWLNAVNLAKVHHTSLWESTISQIDKNACILSRSLLPRGLAKYAVRWARRTEIKNNAKIIEILAS
ncbi:MAG: DUF5995 family protein [Bacteroidia bacterium]